MTFQVKLYSGAPDFESLHVAKLTNYPLEPRDYKPYAQAQFCLSNAGVQVRLTSFEAFSLPDSALYAALRLRSNDPSVILLSLFADGKYGAVCCPDPQHPDMQQPIEEAVLQPFSGEDLQGIYWGGVFSLPYGAPGVCTAAAVGDRFAANFYKICENPQRPHYGSFFPADFQKPLTAIENLGDCVVIDY